jgi:hypothetical protein
MGIPEPVNLSYRGPRIPVRLPRWRGHSLAGAGNGHGARLRQRGRLAAVGELAERATAVIGRTVNSGIVALSMQLLCNAAGVAFGAPEIGAVAGTFTGAVAGSVAEELVNVNYRLWADPFGRLERFRDVAEEASGVSLDELLAEAGKDPRTLQLLARTSEEAARSLDGWKVDMLARAFVDALRTDKVDEAAVVIETLVQFDALHMRLLGIFNQQGPQKLHGPASTDPVFYAWKAEDVTARQPELAEVLDALVARLDGLGLLTDFRSRYGGHDPLWRLSPFGEKCAAYLSARAATLD